MEGTHVHRPRNVGWKRAAALLYGDWGTSKAYVIGAAFLATGFASLEIIIGVCLLTAVVGFNYRIVCKYFPDGGGVYSAARKISPTVAVIGSLLLIADMTVTAALSGWAAMKYLHVPAQYVLLSTVLAIVAIGGINWMGPKHSGSVAVALAIPTVVIVVMILIFAAPHLTTANLTVLPSNPWENWQAFAGVILALSGVEAIANLTGVMKLDPGSSYEHPSVTQTAGRAIAIVAIEVVLGTALLGWAMLSLPHSMAGQMREGWEDMINLLAREYGTMALGAHFGHTFEIVTGVIIGLLLLSAVNTAIGALIGLHYMLGRDGEMPRSFLKLNFHGVPWLPLVIATSLPLIVVVIVSDQRHLMDLYAIGVVGAITVNLGCCLLNKQLGLKIWEIILMGLTFFVLAAVEVTLAWEKHTALFFIACILTGGMLLRSWAQHRAGLRTVTISRELAAAVVPGSVHDISPRENTGQKILVAARGVTNVLRFALEEAKLRKAAVYVLFVKEIAVTLPVGLPVGVANRWQDDPEACRIMSAVMENGAKIDVPVIPVYTVSESSAGTILDLSATLGIDMLILGSPNRGRLATLLRGSVVSEVARNLPDNIQMVIYG
jgi:nucleotide-binding universal stress UspA family protein